MMILSGLGTMAFATNTSFESTILTKNESTSVLFSSPPTQVEQDGFMKIELSGATTQLIESNKPVVPIYIKTYEIPFGSSNIQVTVYTQGYQHYISY